jgi:hypothetical protein
MDNEQDVEQMTIPEKLQHRLNVLEGCLCENVHISDPDGVRRLIQRITPHVEMLNIEDYAYYESALRILEEQIPYDGS